MPLKKKTKVKKKVIKKTKVLPASELVIKTKEKWIKNSLVNKKQYREKYSKSINNNDAFWKKAETDIGITISEDMRNRFGDFSTTPGSVTFLNAPVLREKASLPDIKLAKGMAKESVIAQASSELNIILAEQSKIQTIESNAGPLVPGGTPEEEEEAQQRIAFLKQFYENRSNIILEAQSLFKDNEDPNGLYRIYGTAALRPLYDRIGYFNPVILGEQFEQSRTVPIGVGNSKLYAELYTLGLVKDGQTVSYEGPDGNTITEIVGS